MKEENINQESTNIETNPNRNEINTYSNDILIEDAIKEKEYMSKIEKEPLSLFEFMTEEKFKQWEEKLFNLNPRIKRLIPSEKSNQEIFMNLSQQKIKEKDIINNDSIRTRSRESILLPDFKKLLEQSLQLFCFLSKSNYKQGLNEIFGPLILLKYKFNNLPIYKIINLASALVDKFFPNYFYEKGVFSLKSALALYQILLKYHEPKIYNLLELADIKPELYVINWIINYQSAKFDLNLFFYFWDKMISINDNLFILFFVVALIQYHKELLINSDQNYLNYLIGNLPIKSINDIDIIFNKALELRNNTPYSFRLWANKLGFLHKDNKDVEKNYEKYQPHNFMALPLFPSEILYMIYNNKINCIDPRCINYINNLFKVSPKKGFKKRGENNKSNKNNFQYKDKLYNLKQLYSKEKEHICEKCSMKLNKSFNYIVFDIRMNNQFNSDLNETGSLKKINEDSNISQEELKSVEFDSILVNRYLNRKGKYHFIFLSSETDTFNIFEKKYYKENLTEEDKFKMLYGFMQPINIEKELNFDLAKKHLNLTDTFFLKEYDNMKKSISCLIKNNFPYVSYTYGGYGQIHRECKRFKIELDKHNKNKCFYCKNKNNNINSINDDITLNKKFEEENKSLLYENLWEKKEKINYDKLSSILSNPNIKIFLGVLKEYKTEFIEQDKIQILISQIFDKYELNIYKFNNKTQYEDLENTLIILEQKKNLDENIEDNNKNLELTLLENISINNIISICVSPKNKNVVNIKIKDKNKKNENYNIIIDFSSDKISKNFIKTFKSLISLYKTNLRKK